MERYSSYKDSGIQWLGEIPSHWEVRRLNTFGLFAKGGGISRDNLQDDGKPAILYGDIYTKYNIYADNIINHISESIAEKSIRVFPGDILMTGSGETKEDIGKTIVFRGKEAYIGGDVILFRQVKNNSAFLSYALNSQFAKDYRYRESKGEIIVHIYANNLKRLYLPIPPLSEQQAIASYLDEATAKIDAAIAQQQKMIDLLNERKQIIINNAVTKGLNPNVKMKDSGVDWIGEIPEEWIFCKLKHLTSIISKGTTPSTIGRDIFETGEIRFLKAENIVDNKVQFSPEFYIDDITHGMMKRSNLQKDDILFVIAGATIGKVAIMPKEFIPANTNQAISFIRLIDKSYAPYIWNVLQSDLTKKYIWQNAVQSAQPNISMEDLGNIQIPLPSKAEQIDILHYIENCIKPIEDAISNAEKQIAFLQERKQIIINEVVTGKVKVS